MNQDFSILKSVGWRFLRGFVAGAVSTAALIAQQTATVSSLRDLGVWLAILGYASIVGGITGALLAADKFVRALPAE